MSKIETIVINKRRFDLLKELNSFKKDIQEKISATDYDRNVFLMMKYRPSNKNLSDFILSILEANGLKGVRADMNDWNITGDSVSNPLAVLYCCKYGIALFDTPETGQNFSPNVAYELGIMHYQHKHCLILINKSIVPSKPFDIIGKIHYSYTEELEVKEQIESWLTKNNIKITKSGDQIDHIAVAIVKKANKFLITKRRIKEGDLHWSFPAKKLRPGADEKRAIVKECLSETNIQASVVRSLGERIISNNGSKLRLHYWLCNYKKGKVETKDLDELETVKWVSGREALRLISTDIFPEVKKILQNTI